MEGIVTFSSKEEAYSDNQAFLTVHLFSKKIQITLDQETPCILSTVHLINILFLNNQFIIKNISSSNPIFW